MEITAGQQVPACPIGRGREGLADDGGGATTETETVLGAVLQSKDYGFDWFGQIVGQRPHGECREGAARRNDRQPGQHFVIDAVLGRSF